MNIFSILLVLLSVTVVVGFLTYNNRTGILKLLPWFQLAMLMTELGARALIAQKRNTMGLYDLVTFLELSYFGVMYLIYLRKKANKIVVAGLMLIFYASVAAYLVGWDKVVFSSYNVLSFYLAAIFLIVAAIIYLIETLRSNDIISFNRNPLIWISIGLLLYLSSSSFFLVANYLGVVFVNHQLVHNIVAATSALSLYIFLVVAMLCKRYEQ